MEHVVRDFDIYENGHLKQFKGLGTMYYDDKSSTLYIWDYFILKRVDMNTRFITNIAGDEYKFDIGVIRSMAMKNDELYFTDYLNTINKLHNGKIITVVSNGRTPHGLTYNSLDDELVFTDREKNQVVLLKNTEPNENDCDMEDWGTLPDNLLIHIMRFVSTPKDLNSISFVNKRFFRCSLSDSLWKNLWTRFGNSEDSETASYRQKYYKKWSHFESRVICGSSLGYSDGIGSSVKYSKPLGICFDKRANSYYVADSGNKRIRMITRVDKRDWKVITIAGSGGDGYKDGNSRISTWKGPEEIVFDEMTGSIYVRDSGWGVSNSIRKISKEGIVSTLVRLPLRSSGLCIYNRYLLFGWKHYDAPDSYDIKYLEI